MLKQKKKNKIKRKNLEKKRKEKTANRKLL